LGLRSGERERIHEDDLAVCKLLRENARERRGAHLLVYLHRVHLLRARAVGRTAAHPYRGTRRAVACAAGALLLPGLLAAAGYFAAELGIRDGRAGIRLHAGDDLMDEVRIPGSREQLGRERDGTCLAALDVEDGCFACRNSRLL